jgi:uncharacterized membrane protein (UPF0127 family)
VQRLVNADTGVILASEAYFANSFAARLIGLMGRSEIAPSLALGIPDCDWVHTFGVRLPLDIAYCDRKGTVLRLVENLIPNRAAPRVPGARMTWEMKAGGFSGRVREGQQLVLQPAAKIET